MIIQNSSPMSQAIQPDSRAHGVSVKVVADVPTSTPTPSVSPQPSPEELHAAVATINQALQQSHPDLEFSVDTSTRKTVVKMVDTRTGDLIRQFPSEATLAISRGIEEFQQGLLLRHKA